MMYGTRLTARAAGISAFEQGEKRRRGEDRQARLRAPAGACRPRPVRRARRRQARAGSRHRDPPTASAARRPDPARRSPSAAAARRPLGLLRRDAPPQLRIGERTLELGQQQRRHERARSDRRAMPAGPGRERRWPRAARRSGRSDRGPHAQSAPAAPRLMLSVEGELDRLLVREGRRAPRAGRATRGPGPAAARPRSPGSRPCPYAQRGASRRAGPDRRSSAWCAPLAYRH